ncbi:uncharacterized protein [Chironomus tepperi]|uniref:uncharacterized protein n=1 Tax=Chironomus tepperi TaxID=113505 RepID=UPI00391EF208
MEIIAEGKNFRLVHDDELPSILNELEKYLPYSLKFHQTIKTYLTHRVWQFYFYVSKEWPDENIPVFLHFPGCTSTPNNHIYESFGFFCPIDSLDYVNMLQTEDILFDWSMPMYLNYTHELIVDRMEEFFKNIGHIERIQGEVYICKDNINKLELGELRSNEVEMRLLCAQDVKGIHDLYPASEIESIELFEKLSEVLPGYGVFTVDGELAAWMIQSYYGAMFSMQTKPEHRRKGYGIYLAQNLARLVIKRGYKPFVVIRHENDASRSLYTKLGFEKVFDMARIKLYPFDSVKMDKDESNGHENGNHVNSNKRVNNHDV